MGAVRSALNTDPLMGREGAEPEPPVTTTPVRVVAVDLEARLEQLESFIVEKMAETRIPGLSIALFKDGEVVYQRGFGFRDIERGLEATPRTVYGVGSITKTVTAIAVLQLVEKGAISLDDPVGKYVGLDLRARGEPVRIEHLLTHTSGIPALGYAEAFIRGFTGAAPTWLPAAKPDDVIPFMRGASDWASHRPGERFFYLNEGYVLLGKVIERVTGTSYEDYVRRNILEPLGMSRSYFSREEVESDPDVATPYLVTRDGQVKPSRFPYGISADGGMLSNVLDLIRLARALMGYGRLEDRVILGSDTVREMVKPRARLPYTLFGGEAYGYGVIVYPSFLGRYKLVGHSGSVLVYTGFYGYVEGENVAVAVLANASGYPPSGIGMYALALALGHDPEELPFVRADRVLRRLEGVYEGYAGTIRMTVRRLGDFLMLEYSDAAMELRLPLVPERLDKDHAVFWTLEFSRRIPVEFEIKGDGVVMYYERYKLVKRGVAR